ncbi:hypothetical protein EJ02DRAFT_455474 [Clathrospora elynae]|uniref:Thymidylate kinase n=1 Tax=Clathrospora elynae TaxID=706981 RepID=A0A6A5SK63_9PLEO|nr:hypothetical protein EJ02DRAFT_455474 [Clathrospora elynae]
MATFTRQPFAEIGSSRLQVLQSAKNRQNAISPNFASPQSLKPSPTQSTGKRQRVADIYEDAPDAENMDPSLFNSPTKKPKTSSDTDAGYIKPAKLSLFRSPAKPTISLNAAPSVPSIRKALSSPKTTKSTPITNSRGSPKNKRLHAISKRRASSSSFRRVDPPSFTHSSPALPFSIDAALSGSIPSYTPKAPTVAATPVSAPQQASALDESMPTAWFFEIHEDTPEQEAANLMEHSASVLDISTDDDADTKNRNGELERGKENIPPPSFLLSQSRNQAYVDAMDDGLETDIEEPVKRPRLRKFVQDAMDEDRKPLGDLAPSEFYGEGCDSSSYVTVDAGIEKPSSLSKEFDFSCPTPEKKRPEREELVEVTPVVEEVEVEKVADIITVRKDEPTITESPAPVLPSKDVTPVIEPASHVQQELLAAS